MREIRVPDHAGFFILGNPLKICKPLIKSSDKEKNNVLCDTVRMFHYGSYENETHL